MKHSFSHTLRIVSRFGGLLCLLSGLATSAQATNVYYDINGATSGSGIANGGSYSWESSFWSTSSAGTVATAGWSEGNFPEFAAGTDAATASYTVTTHSAHTIAGMLERTSSGTVTISGSTLTIAAGSAGGGGVGQGFYFGPGNIVINNVLAGTGGIIPQCNSGCGNLTLNGNNTFSGGFNMGGGNIVFIGNANALGTGPIYFNGVTYGAFGNDGVMDFLGNNFTIPNDVNMGSGLYSTGVAIQEQFIFDDANAHSVTFSGDWTTGTSTPTYLQFGNQGANQTFTISGNISGTTGFTNYGTGTLVLSGANTFGGTLVLAGSGAIITVGGGGTLKSTLNIINGGTFNYNSTANQTLSGTLSGTGAFKQLGSGTLTLSGANSYTGGTTISGGILSANTLSDANCAIGPSGTLTLSGGTLKYTGTSAATTARAVTVSGTASIIDLANGALTLSGAVKSGTINKNSASTLTLSGSTDNASLGVVINGGTVVFNKASSSTVHAVGAATTVNSGGTLQLSGSGGDQIYQGVNVTVNSGGVFDANGKSEGLASLSLAGSGSGSGALLNGAAATTATLTGTAAVGFPLAADAAVGGAGNLTLAGVVGGAHSLTKLGAGTLKLNSADLYSGGTFISAGTLEVAGSIQGDVTLNAGVLQLDNATALAATATLNLPASPAAGAVNLAFNGTQTIGALNFGGVAKAQGTWGSLTSSAQHKSAAFTGNGLLDISSGATTTTTLTQTVGANPCTYGDALTFTASVAGNAPSGTVQFYLDGVAAGTPVALSAGSAAFSPSALSVAGSPHQITASYSGDDNNTGSAASPFVVTVRAATVTVTVAGLLTYGEDPTNAVYTPSYSGFVNGDTASVVTGSADFSTDATAQSYVGSNYVAHVVDLGTLSAANYTFAAGADGVMTVTNRSLTVAGVTASDKPYDGTTAASVNATSATLVGVVNGDDDVTNGLAAVSLDSSGVAGAFASANAGMQSVQMSGLLLAGDLGTNYVLIQPTTTATITKADPTVTTWPTATAITYGQTLADSTLGSDGVASVPGGFGFTAPATAPTAGTAAQSVTFTPTDADNYNTVSGTVSVTVNKATPMVTTWPTATAITYGQTLADSTLSSDGAASVPGSFAFTTLATAPHAGTAAQSVTFTPTDADNYSAVSGTVSVTVNPATLMVSADGLMTYGDDPSNAVYTASYTGFQNGDTASLVTGGANFGTDATAQSYVGSNYVAHMVDIGTLSAPNYTFAAGPNGVMTVTNRVLTVSGVTANDKPYDGGTGASVNAAGATLVGVVNGDDDATNGLAAVSLDSSGVAGTFASAEVGAQSVQVSGLLLAGDLSTNYVLLQPTTTATITKADPTVTTWPTATAITYGQTLADSSLSDGVASVLGGFAFTTLSTAPNAGTAAQSVTFTPEDTDHYNPVSGTVNVTVNKATSSVSVWPTATAITYGQTLADSTLSDNWEASVPGSFAFTTLSLAPHAGTAAQSVTFTPTDADNYNPVSGTVSVTVNKATPAVTTWPTASSIVYGQTLGDSHFSGGVASTAGEFGFTAPATAPTVGTAAQSVVFTPTDADDFNPVSGTVDVTVSPADSSLHLASSLNPATNGNSVTFTATVTSSVGTPTGSVVFLTNGVALATVPLSGGVASTSTADLPVGTLAVQAQYAAQANWQASVDSLSQEVRSAVTLSTTNTVLSIVDNGGGVYTLNCLGTPGAQYYVVSGADVSAPLSSWAALRDSTNTAAASSGLWSFQVSNPAPAFYRTVAINPAP